MLFLESLLLHGLYTEICTKNSKKEKKKRFKKIGKLEVEKKKLSTQICGGYVCWLRHTHRYDQH